ncbi:MAG: CdaR family protein [Vicinamibacterales bacterium]
MTLERLREFLTREAALRLLASIALALILWALVTLRQDPETSRAFNDVPVQALSLDPSLVIVNELDPVRVQLSGPESDVTPIDGGALVANIDFSSVEEPGVYDLPVTIAKPSGVWNSTVSPATASVVVEQSESKPFRLAPVVTDLDENSLRTVTVYPEVDQVTVTGPTSLIDAIAQVVLPVEVSGGTQTFDDIYVPEARDKDGNVIAGVSIEPAAVSATVRVSARGKSVAVLATITGSPATGYEVADRTVNPQFVIVDGDESVLDSLVALSTEPIDVSGADASFTRTVGVADLPEGVQILQPSSAQVEVLVQITQRGVHQSLPSQQVTVVGVGDGLVASVSPDEITIDVVAPDDALAGLDASTLQVIVDASGLEAGTYSVQPSVIMPPRVQWVTTFPSEVTLTLSPATEPAASSPSPATQEAATPESAP